MEDVIARTLLGEVEATVDTFDVCRGPDGRLKGR
jgi:hypothetical protein